MDDLLVINSPDFVDTFPRVYPPHTGITMDPTKLPAKRDILSQTHFLDVHIMITLPSLQLITTLYNKCDAFPFHAMRMPPCQSNLASESTVSTLFSEFLRIYKINNQFSFLANDLIRFITYLLKDRNYERYIVKLAFKKFARYMYANNMHIPSYTRLYKIIQSYK